MTKLLPAGVLLVGMLPAMAQLNVRERDYELILGGSWIQAQAVAPGFDRGFERTLAQGQKAVILLHSEVMPAGAGAPPSDTSEMERQFDTLVRSQYPDARAAGAPAFRVNGRILVNVAYDLTESGSPVRQSYTYFLVGRTALVVQCTAPRERWAEASGEFASILATLRAVSSERQQKLSDAAALESLRKRLPAVASSLPAEWACEIRDVAIMRSPSGPEGGTLLINVAFRRGDIGEIYESAKVLFTAMASARSEAELSRRGDVSGLMKYVGELWGMAWGVVADCERPIGRFQIVIQGAARRMGAISLSAEDGVAVLSGKITASDQTRVGKMYRFE
ncbi:MAG: hypothetical protein ACLQGV_08380 [Bryobacteraceae bacterium]